MHPNETYVNETWPVNNLERGSSSNSVPSSPWTYASQDRLLENLQHSNSMYPRSSAVPAGEHYHLIENQHLNSACSEGAGPSDQEFFPQFYLTDIVQVNPMYPERAVPGELNYLFANQQFSSVPGEQNFYYIDNEQLVDSVIPEVESFSIHDLYPEELPVDCNNQIALELAEFHDHSYVWSSQASGGEPGASSSASAPSAVSAFECHTVCSTPEPEALLDSPIATDHPSTDKSWHLLPAEHRFTSSKVATSDSHEGVSTKKKKKARKWQCEVRISKKLRKSDDMIRREKLWITFDRREQADRATQVSKFLLSGSKTKYVDTQFDPPEIEPQLRDLRTAMQERGVDSIMYRQVVELAEWYGKHGATLEAEATD